VVYLPASLANYSQGGMGCPAAFSFWDKAQVYQIRIIFTELFLGKGGENSEIFIRTYLSGFLAK
jgi:hypothetical protein